MATKLYRKTLDKKIAGVCAGLAEYFEVDVALVRFAFIFSILIHGLGLLAYIILWIAMPEQPLNFAAVGSAATPAEPIPSFIDSRVAKRRHHGALFVGILLILVGFSVLLDNFLPWISFDNLYPVLFIVGGVLILAYGYVSRDRSADESVSFASFSTGNAAYTEATYSASTQRNSDDYKANTESGLQDARATDLTNGEHEGEQKP